MTREVFEKALKEGIHSFYYIFKDFGIGRDCKHFVETGTYMGDAVNYAVGLGFEQIFSCELSEERYNHCLEKFKDNDNVNLWLGDSRDCVKEILKKVDQKACFWLDAHAEGGGVPTMEELDMIKEVSHPNRQDMRVLNNPIRIDGERLPISPGPKLGNYTEHILKEIGYTDEDITALRKDKKI